MVDELIQLKPITVSISQLVLDPANPRLVTADDPEADESTYSDCFALAPAEQAHLLDVMKTDANGFRDLLNKVRSQGFLPIDRIVVRKAKCDEPPVPVDHDMYVVLEGNRRVATLKTLLDSPATAMLDASIKQSFDPIEVLLYEGDDPEVAWRIQGLRHIAGVREWGAFQRARYLYQMTVQQGVAIEDLHEATGYPVAEVIRYVNSYIGFRQARQIRGSLGEDRFSVFQEAVFAGGAAGGNLRKWLTWDGEEKKFKNIENLEMMLTLLLGDDEGAEVTVSGALELRNKFSKLVPDPNPHPDLLASFLSGEISLDEADLKRRERLAAESAKKEEAELDSRRAALEESFSVVDSLPIGKVDRSGRISEFRDLLVSLRDVSGAQVGVLDKLDPSGAQPPAV